MLRYHAFLGYRTWAIVTHILGADVVKHLAGQCVLVYMHVELEIPSHNMVMVVRAQRTVLTTHTESYHQSGLWQSVLSPC